MKTKTEKLNDDCKIHGSSSRAVNKTLLFLILASLSLVIWHVWVYGPTGHEIQPGSSPRPFLIMLGHEIWDLIFSGHGIIAELEDVFIYFIVGILLAGLIRTYKLAIKLRNILNRYGFVSIFLASLVGILTPLCACGILTTAMSLLFAGLPLAPVMALLVSSPLISPSSYLLTLSDLGPHWTVIRTVAAFSMGIFAGIITHLLRNRGFQTNMLFLEGAVVQGDFHDESYPDERLKCSCKIRFGNRVAAKTKNMFLIFLAKSSEMLWSVGKYVLVGIAVGSIIERYMPSEWIYSLFGQDGPLNIVWITLGAVPIFLHQISASSILYHIKSTLDGTLNGGAGLAFLIGGPVTAIPTMTMLWALFKKRVFFLYMFICFAGTIILAYSFQYFILVPHVDTDNPVLRGVSSISGGSSGIITKVNKDVIIVMDPGGKSIISTYENDLEGKGGIVIDSGFDRFVNTSSKEYNNQRYITNIAGWLQEHSGSIEHSILVYNTFTRSGLSIDELNINLPAVLEKETGAAITITDRNETPEVSGALLEDYSQLWILFGESGPDCCFSDDELEMISGFNEAGGSIFIVAGVQDKSGQDWTAANRMVSRFGVTLSGRVENGEELRVSTIASLFEKVSGIFETMYRFMT